MSIGPKKSATWQKNAPRFDRSWNILPEVNNREKGNERPNCVNGKYDRSTHLGVIFNKKGTSEIQEVSTRL